MKTVFSVYIKPFILLWECSVCVPKCVFMCLCLCVCVCVCVRQGKRVHYIPLLI